MRRVRSLPVNWGRHPGWLIGFVAYPLIAIVTVGALAIAFQGFARAREFADQELETQAVAAARDADRFVSGRLDALGAISQSLSLQFGRAQDIQTYLDRIAATTTLDQTSWIDRDGILRARSGGVPAGPLVSFTDRDFVQNVLSTQRPSIGNAVIGKVQPTLTVPMGYPTFSREGVLTGVLGTGFRLDGSDASEIQFGGVSGLRVLDRSNHLIIGDGPITTLLDVASWRTSAGIGRNTGVSHGSGVLGEADHVAAYATSSQTGWLIVVDRSAEAVYGKANSVLRLEIIGITMFSIFAAAGVAWGMFWLERDAARVNAAEQAAEHGRRLRNELIAALGHDLGNPLTIIRGHAGLLRRKLGTENTSPMEIEQSARRMQRMIQGLMDLSTGDAAVELSRDEVDLVPLVQMLVDERRLLERAREFELECDAEHLIGQWDRMRVERVIDNLLSNAVKYSPPESLVTLRLNHERRAQGEVAVVEVLDRGIGIPEGERNRVFDAFFRGSNTGGQLGSGLGLASVRRVVEQHGGTIEISAREGGGTAVRIRLPLEARPAVEREPQQVGTAGE